MADLSVADQQMVEIAKAMVHKVKLLILDEPTAVISGKEVDMLFQRLAALKTDGQADALMLRLDPANGGKLIAGADLVVDAADSFAVTYTRPDLCFALGKPPISASVIGRTGYLCGFSSPAPSYCAVFPAMPAPG